MSGGFSECISGWVEPGRLSDYDWTANHYGSETEKKCRDGRKTLTLGLSINKNGDDDLGRIKMMKLERREFFAHLSAESRFLPLGADRFLPKGKTGQKCQRCALLSCDYIIENVLS